jgi:hypothetical protein
MGGEAGADSILGQGSRFWFCVRLARNTAAARAAYLLPSLRVLVVDDLGASRDALGAMLRALGARVALCASQAEALALLKAADAAASPSSWCSSMRASMASTMPSSTARQFCTV